MERATFLCHVPIFVRFCQSFELLYNEMKLRVREDWGDQHRYISKDIAKFLLLQTLDVTIVPNCVQLVANKDLQNVEGPGLQVTVEYNC